MHSTAFRSWLRAHWILLLLMGLAAAAAVVVRNQLFPFYSIDRDEPVYVLQAKALLDGHVTLPVYRDLPFFQPWLTGVHDGRLIFEFPPGYAAVLAVSLALTGSLVPALAFVAALTVLGMYLLGVEASGRRDVGLVAAGIMIATPVFLVQSGLFLSYLFTLAVGLFAGWALLRGARTGRAPDLAAGGAFLGVIFVTRHLDALLWGIPFVVFVVVTGAVHRDRFRSLAARVGWVVAGFAPLALVMAAFNARVSGSPTKFPIEAADPLNSFGFGQKRIMVGAHIIPFTKHDALDAIATNFREGRLWVFGGLAGVALALVGVYIARRKGATYVLLALVVSFTVGHFFYWGITLMATGAPAFGPMYYLPMLAPLAVLGATALVACWRWRRVIALAIAVLIVALTVPRFRDKVDQARFISIDWYDVQHRAIERFHGRNALLFISSGQEPYVLTDLSFAMNSPTLDGRVLYAVDRDLENVDLVARSSRTPYRLVTTLRNVGRDGRAVAASAVHRLDLVRGPRQTFRAHITNTSGAPVVTTWFDVAGARTEMVLDRASFRGASYDLQWSVAAPGQGAPGATTLSPGPAWVVVGARFDDGNESDAGAAAFEHRFPTSTRHGQVRMLTPGRRFGLADTAFGRILVESRPSRALAVSVSPSSG